MNQLLLLITGTDYQVLQDEKSDGMEHHSTRRSLLGGSRRLSHLTRSRMFYCGLLLLFAILIIYALLITDLIGSLHHTSTFVNHIVGPMQTAEQHQTRQEGEQGHDLQPVPQAETATNVDAESTLKSEYRDENDDVVSQNAEKNDDDGEDGEEQRDAATEQNDETESVTEPEASELPNDTSDGLDELTDEPTANGELTTNEPDDIEAASGRQSEDAVESQQESNAGTTSGLDENNTATYSNQQHSEPAFEESASASADSEEGKEETGEGIEEGTTTTTVEEFVAAGNDALSKNESELEDTGQHKESERVDSGESLTVGHSRKKRELIDDYDVGAVGNDNSTGLYWSAGANATDLVVDGNQPDTASGVSTYRKLVESLKKFFHIAADDDSRTAPENEQPANATDETPRPPAADENASPSNYTDTVAMSTVSMTTAMPGTTYGGSVTEDHTIWWNASCWTLLSAEVDQQDDDGSHQCSRTLIIDQRDAVFDEVTLSQLNVKCLPGEWCLGDSIDFGEEGMGAVEQLRQLCNASVRCSLPPTTTDNQDCGELSFFFNAVDLLCNALAEPEVMSSSCLTSLRKLLHVTLLRIVNIKDDDVINFEFNIRKALQCSCLYCDNNTSILERLPEWARLLQQDDTYCRQKTIDGCEHFGRGEQNDIVFSGVKSTLDKLRNSQLTSVAVLLVCMFLTGLSIVLVSYGTSRSKSELRFDPARSCSCARDRIEYSIISTDFDDPDDDDDDEEDFSGSLPIIINKHNV